MTNFKMPLSPTKLIMIKAQKAGTRKIIITAKINPQRLTFPPPPQRWAQKDGKGQKTGDLGAHHTQKAGFPRKLALWIGKDGFSYTQILGSCSRVDINQLFEARNDPWTKQIQHQFTLINILSHATDSGAPR